MAEFKLERFKYTWKGEWSSAVAYRRDDIVSVGGKSYVCLVGHTSDTNFATDLNYVLPGSNPPLPQPKWRIMTDGRKFIGTWATSTLYNVGDIVTKDGSLWLCVNEHTSSNFVNNKDDWTIYIEHIKFTSNWQASTDYSNGALVKYNGIVYRCIEPHVSGVFLEDNLVTTPEDLNVTVAEDVEGVSAVGAFYINITEQPNLTLGRGKTYLLNQSDSSNIEFGGTIHPLLFSETEDGTLQGGTIYNNGVKYFINGDEVDSTTYVSQFASATTRQIQITVPFDAPDTLYYYCRYHGNMGGTLTIEDTADVAWEVFHNGVEYTGAWQTSTTYRKNDLVLYGGTIWICTETHQSNDVALDTTKFRIELPGFQFDGEWNSTTQYQPGDVVRYGGYLYFCNAYNLDDQPAQEADSTQSWVVLQYSYNFRGDWTNGAVYNPGDIVLRGGDLYMALVSIGAVEADGSTMDYLQPDVWELLVPSKAWGGPWLTGTEYYVGDVVYYFGDTYVCNEYHLANTMNFPGDNGSGYFYWDLLVQAGQPAGLTRPGDLLTYGLTREQVGDGSTLGPTNIPIGEKDLLLSITAEQEAFWRRWENQANVIYVGQNGVDDDGYGTDIFNPFRTVRYAAQYIEDNLPPLTPTKIKVDTGRFEEIGPISVPAGCVVMGDELRSATIVANDAIEEYQNETQWQGEILDYLDVVLLSILENNLEFVPTTGNTGRIQKIGPALGLLELNYTTVLKTDYKDFIEYSTQSGAINPTLVGTNTLTATLERRQYAAKLELNKKFILDELIAYTRVNYPNKVFTDERLKADFHELLRGFIYDLRYEGNYKTLLAARRYSNGYLGTKFDDLFWLRDVTGLRNCTTEGLEGTLNPPGVYDLYQRPTGGAYCALDPGWGPDDNRTWINTRSPYIQGVTTIGNNCVGQKIDGALHNGGNKSFVSNDFTQVLSDGVGAWVLNNARAELVSVFTYYNQVGYLAENGGIIRATNGNNSYGSFGAVADGLDPNEVPQSVKVWNRDNSVNVDSVFAGLFSDELFAFEYEHAGEEFTQATGTITGAGINASVAFEDFRDGGLFQSRLTSYQDSGSTGGVGYFVAQNNVQSGNQTTLTLANSEEATEAQILGCRIWIIAGDGTGQYGYVQAYNQGSRLLSVYKESDSTPGFDHIVPGTPILTTLSQNARYRIEPRITVSHPGFSDTLHNLPDGREIIDLAFSETTATFTGIEGTPGSGQVIEDDGLQAANAVFTVVKNGTTYEVTVTDAGLGYAVGDTIFIPGTDLGGISPDNDLTISVASTSEDSSNSIASIAISGVGKSGNFCAIANPNYVLYSDDGINWSEANLPNADAVDWKKIVAGNNRFFALAKDTDYAAYSLNGITWTAVTMPVDQGWTDVAFGEGRFVAVAENSNTAAYSDDAVTWTTSTIPDDGVGDSTASQFEIIAYGQGKWVALSANDQVIAQTTNGITWTTTTDSDLPPNAEFTRWVSMAFGNNRFVALSDTGSIYYSLNGSDWQDGGDMPTQDGSTVMNWRQMKYSQGVFFAVCDTGGQVVGADPAGLRTNFVATSEDGFTWTGRILSSTQQWCTIGAGTIDGVHYWISLAYTTPTNSVSRISTGCRAKVRANIGGSSAFDSINIFDPGSGYSASNLPVFTVYDNEHTVAVSWENRVGNGVLAQPSWINRGSGYRTNSTTVTITGDGYADVIPEGNIVKFYGVTKVPGPGTQILFSNLPDEATEDPTDLKSFRAAVITDLGDDGTGQGTRLVQIRISPRARNEYNLVHDTSAVFNLNFSQCRISGHDFLDVGTGNFEETNYPDLYAGGAYFTAAPENEVYETNGGRVYYVSTDQDGNFRAGELFSVQQSTGIVTISAEFFDLDGLSELALGGVRLGGSGAVVREFSTDPTFAEDSNNVVPTQRAIATFLADRLSVGGSDLTLNSFVAGSVKVGTEQNLIASNIPGGTIDIPVPVTIAGTDDLGNPVAISGSWVAQMLYYRNDVEGMK